MSAMIEDNGAPARVLVVDDDPDMRHLLVNYLEQNDMHARPAYSRQDAAAALNGDEPNIVILDLRLGQDDGLDLLREIRARS
ncbi:MAG TPA: response regulator, partial [Alphaproteobacteria bacterium]|nr:response regulator [Alphaproteobacteria bacterium]